MSHKADELEYDRLMIILQGHAAFQLVWAGTQLALFDALSNKPGMTRNEIARLIQLKDQPARILLTGLSALGIIKKQGDTFRNADVVEEYLVSGKKNSVSSILGWQHHIVYKGLVDFVDSLKEGSNVGLRHFPGEGDTLYQRLANQPEIEKVFQDSMSALSHQANKTLIDVLDLSGASHLMDVGGGDATNAIAIATKFPHLHLTVFDSPSVCKIARKNIQDKHLADRIDTHPGDLFSTEFPKGIDAILFSHMLTIWSPAENKQILQKTFNALPPGGQAIIFNMMGNDEDTGPLSTALGSPYFLTIATGKGMLYSWLDYQEWIESIGFSKVERIEQLPMDHGVFIGIK